MTEETEIFTIRLLQEIRAAQQATDAKLDAFITEQRGMNGKMDTRFDKLGIEIAGVKGRIRNVEELMESMARVMSESPLI